MSIEAMKLALEALGWTDEWRPQGLKERALTALSAAIEATEKQEPVGEMQNSFLIENMVVPVVPVALPAGTKLYVNPPAQPAQRKPLTDEEIMQTWEGVIKYAPGEVRLKDFARAIEAAHGIKENNT